MRKYTKKKWPRQLKDVVHRRKAITSRLSAD